MRGKKRAYEPVVTPQKSVELETLLLGMRIKALTHLISLMELLNAKPSPELKKDLQELAKAIAKLSS